MSLYPAHGSFNLSINGNIVVAHIHGSWNIETAHNYIQHCQQLAAPLLGSHWGHLVFLDEWVAGIPGVKETLEQHVQWSIDNNLKRTAAVYSPSMFKQSYIQSIVQDAKQFVMNTFDNSEDAIQWLAEQGYHLDHPELVSS